MNFIIDLKVYPFDVMVSFGESDDKLRKKLSGLGIDNEDHLWQYGSDTCVGRAATLSNNASILRMRKNPETATEFATLHHEIFHVVTFVMMRVGIKLKILVSDEAYAYLIGYITKEIYKKL